MQGLEVDNKIQVEVDDVGEGNALRENDDVNANNAFFTRLNGTEQHGLLLLFLFFYQRSGQCCLSASGMPSLQIMWKCGCGTRVTVSTHARMILCSGSCLHVCACVRETDRKGAAERSVTAFSGCKRGRRARQKPQIKLHTILKETLAEVGEILFKSLSLRVHWHNTCSLKTFNYPLSRTVVSEYKLPLWRNLPCFVKFSSGCPHCSLWPHKISFLQSEALDLSLFVFLFVFADTGYANAVKPLKHNNLAHTHSECLPIDFWHRCSCWLSF